MKSFYYQREKNSFKFSHLLFFFQDKEQGKNILMYAIEFHHYDVISVILKTASWEHIKKMMTDKSDKGETCLTLVNSFDKNHELFFKQCKLKQTLQDYNKRVTGELP